MQAIIFSQSEFAAIVIQANPGWPGLVDHAQSRYISKTRGHCVLIKNIILTLLAWMSLYTTSQQTSPSQMEATFLFHVSCDIL